MVNISEVTRRTPYVQCKRSQPHTNRNQRHDGIAIPYRDSEMKERTQSGPSIIASLGPRDDLHTENDDERGECQGGVAHCLRRSQSVSFNR